MADLARENALVAEVSRLRAEVAQAKAQAELLMVEDTRRINELKAEVARLTRERDEWWQQARANKEAWIAAKASAAGLSDDALRACVTQLVGALREAREHYRSKQGAEALAAAEKLLGPAA